MRKEIYPERVELRLTERQKDKLQEWARKRDLTLSQVIRDLIDEVKK